MHCPTTLYSGACNNENAYQHWKHRNHASLYRDACESSMFAGVDKMCSGSAVSASGSAVSASGSAVSASGGLLKVVA